jgi:Zn-dependent peptidase ImmA (M78 family)
MTATTLMFNASREADDLLDLYATNVPGELVFPVDSVSLAKRLGLDVYGAELDPNLAGVLMKELDGPTMILLNQDVDAVQRRLTCAHEIGHFLYHVNSDERQDEYSYADYLDQDRSTPEEVAADEFAFELLMPKRFVVQEAGHAPSVLRLAALFGVPVETMRSRLVQLNIAFS